MKLLLNVLIGFTFSIAATCPGLSESAIAVMWGVYDDLIFNVSNLTNKKSSIKEKLESFKWLSFIGIGFVIGYVIFAKLLSFLMVEFPSEIAIIFIGFVLGIVPSLLKNEVFNKKVEKEETHSSDHHDNNIKYLLIGFLVIISIVVSKWLLKIDTSHHSSEDFKHFYIDVNWKLCLNLFIVAFISGIALALPGLSGALLMMILGQYFNIMGMVSNIISSHFLYVIPLSCFGLGVVVSFLVTSKIMEKLLVNHRNKVMNFVTGLIIGSVFAIFNGIPSGIINIIISLVLSIAVFMTINLMMNKYSYADNH